MVSEAIAPLIIDGLSLPFIMSETILIADDDPVFVELLRFKLSHAGFDIVTVSNGDGALEYGLAQEFGLIITDHQMPGLTGVELCRRLRSEGPNINTPIVFCTGKGFEIDHERLTTELGVRKILNKPFSPRELVAFVQEELATATP